MQYYVQKYVNCKFRDTKRSSWLIIEFTLKKHIISKQTVCKFFQYRDVNTGKTGVI